MQVKQIYKNEDWDIELYTVEDDDAEGINLYYYCPLSGAIKAMSLGLEPHYSFQKYKADCRWDFKAIKALEKHIEALDEEDLN